MADRGVDVSRAQPSSTAVGGKINQAGEPRIVGLESVRAMAAIVVVWTHAWSLSRGAEVTTYPQRLVDGGIYSVWVFFVMSGYLLYWPFVQATWGNRSPVSVRNYLLNRAWRVLPAYYVCLVVVMLLQFGPWSRYGSAPFSWWLAFGTFTEDFSHTTLGLVDTPMWSVATEVEFYLLLPLIAWAIGRVSRGSLRTGAIALAALAIPTFVAREVIRYGLPLTDNLQYLDNTLIECFCYFALGMALALWRLSIQKRRPRWLDGPFGHSTVWLLGSLALWLIACYDFNWEGVGGLASFLVVGAVVLPLRHGRLMTPFRWRWLALLGVISYSIYLWHYPIMVAISNRSLTNPFPVVGRGLTELFVIGLPVSVAVAALSYWQVERRGLARRRPWSANTVSATPEIAESAGAASREGGHPAAGVDAPAGAASAAGADSPAGARVPG